MRGIARARHAFSVVARMNGDVHRTACDKYPSDLSIDQIAFGFESQSHYLPRSPETLSEYRSKDMRTLDQNFVAKIFG